VKEQGITGTVVGGDATAQMYEKWKQSGGWIVGDRAYYLDLPKDSVLKPTVRTRQGRQQLTIPLSGGKVDRTLTYSLVW
jgi:hypothetical protein